VITIAAIVEGAGEVAALPILLRRINGWRTPDVLLQAPRPIRVHRDRFLNRDDEFRRHLLLAAAKCGETGWILVLLDADDNCPAELGKTIQRRAETYVPHRRVSVVLANREYEAWFIAAAESLAGQRGFAYKPADAIDAEATREAKGWIKAHMGQAATRKRRISQPFPLAWICTRRSGAAGLFRSSAASGKGRWLGAEIGLPTRNDEPSECQPDVLSAIGDIPAAIKCPDLPNFLAVAHRVRPIRRPSEGPRDVRPRLYAVRRTLFLPSPPLPEALADEQPLAQTPGHPVTEKH
jgi:hypothetical protein